LLQSLAHETACGDYRLPLIGLKVFLHRK